MESSYPYDLKSPDAGFFWAYMGQALAVILCSIGAAYGTAKAGAGLASAVSVNPAQGIKLSIPVIMASILSIYGLIVSMTMSGMVKGDTITFRSGMLAFGAGFTIGISGLAAGISIGQVSTTGIRCVAKEPRLFVVLIIIMIFAEALAIFGLICALMMSTA